MATRERLSTKHATNQPAEATSGVEAKAPQPASDLSAEQLPASIAAQAAALDQASGGRPSRAGQALLQLQRLYGNRHVQRLLAHAGQPPIVQASLVLGPADDPYEREAEQVAEQVVSQQVMAQPGALASDGGGDEVVRRAPDIQPVREAAGEPVTPEVQQAIATARGGGQPLPEHIRVPMEQAFGADFSGVRVHTDERADTLSRALQARAFTTGQDIFFQRGSIDRRLWAHELTHTIQQMGGSKRAPRLIGRRRSNAGAALHGRVQRKMGFKEKDLKGKLSIKALGNKLTNNESTFSRIRHLLRKYTECQEEDKGRQHKLLLRLQFLAREWLTKHASETSKNSQEKKNSLEDMLASIDIELKQIYSDYLGAVDSTNNNFETPRYMTNKALNQAQYTIDISKGNKIQDKAMADKVMEARNAAREFSITDEELIAIRTYSVQDYRYINPILAGNRPWLQGVLLDLKREGREKGWADYKPKKTGKGWLDSQNEETGKIRYEEIELEAKRHAIMVRAGLKKIPSFQGTVYRGTKLIELGATTENVSKLKGKELYYKYFLSTSKTRSVAEKFLKEGLGDGSPDYVILVLKSKSGKAIDKMSFNSGECEVLFDVGSRFKITKVQLVDPESELGQSAQAAPQKPTIYEIHAEEIERGMSPFRDNTTDHAKAID